MKALVFSRKPARYAAAMVAGSLRPGRGARYGPLSLRDVDPPELPGPDWLRFRPRLSGICGSDLATIDGQSSRYFEPIVSFPFMPGHEVVGDLDDGRRAVVVPVLTCATRGIAPPCDQCAAGRINLCERIAFGHLEPGLQCGFCESTGGGWSQEMVVHPSPARRGARGAHRRAGRHRRAAGVRGARRPPGRRGPGRRDRRRAPSGLLTIAALRRLSPATEILATAKHPDQRRWAKELGADVIVRTGRAGPGRPLDHRLAGHRRPAHRRRPAVVDCVGSEATLTQALQVVAPGGTVHAVGMPGRTTLDLTALWHRETSLRGCYAYERADFDTALDLVAELDLGRLVTATYPLSRYEDAIDHAAHAGARGAVKIAFDLRADTRGARR